MEGSPGDFFEASKDDQHKYINQLLALVRRFSEREESSEDEGLRWSKARFAAAMVARTTGHMDTETFKAESSYHAAWLALAVGGCCARWNPVRLILQIARSLAKRHRDPCCRAKRL